MSDLGDPVDCLIVPCMCPGPVVPLRKLLVELFAAEREAIDAGHEVCVSAWHARPVRQVLKAGEEIQQIGFFK